MNLTFLWLSSSSSLPGMFWSLHCLSDFNPPVMVAHHMSLVFENILFSHSLVHVGVHSRVSDDGAGASEGPKGSW